jgi:hypothetical protein
VAGVVVAFLVGGVDAGSKQSRRSTLMGLVLFECNDDRCCPSPPSSSRSCLRAMGPSARHGGGGSWSEPDDSPAEEVPVKERGPFWRLTVDASSGVFLAGVDAMPDRGEAAVVDVLGVAGIELCLSSAIMILGCEFLVIGPTRSSGDGDGDEVAIIIINGVSGETSACSWPYGTD